MSRIRSDRVRHLVRLPLAVLLVVVGGCATLDLPERFLVIDEDLSSVKAITPDEAKVWMRTFYEPGGDLAFWAEAVEKDFKDNRGYVLVEKGELDTKSGPAWSAVFETTTDGVNVRYFVALSVRKTFLGESAITVVEYTADKDLFDTYLEDVRSAVKAR